MRQNFQVGDWCYSSFPEEPCRIVSIKEDKGGYRSVIVDKVDGVKDIASLSPIPLTPLILEKNGFTDWADHSRTIRSCSILIDRTNIIVQKIDGTDYIFTQIHRGGADSCEFRMDLKYVHELQHVLRLCGINETIEP